MIYSLIFILFLHFLADYVIKFHSLSDIKQDSVYPLFTHLVSYFIVIFIGSYFIFATAYLSLYFAVFSVAIHYSIDLMFYKIIGYCNYRGISTSSNFIKIIEGFSQFILQSCLILVYLYLINY